MCANTKFVFVGRGDMLLLMIFFPNGQLEQILYKMISTFNIDMVSILLPMPSRYSLMPSRCCPDALPMVSDAFVHNSFA